MIDRRTILRGMSALPVAIREAQHHATARWMGTAANSQMGGVNEHEGSMLDITNDTTEQFKSFAQWFRAGGDEEIKHEASRIDGFDPDLITMALPITTKVRIQRRRNYETSLKSREKWFENTLKRNGIVKWVF